MLCHGAAPVSPFENDQGYYLFKEWPTFEIEKNTGKIVSTNGDLEYQTSLSQLASSMNAKGYKYFLSVKQAHKDQNGLYIGGIPLRVDNKTGAFYNCKDGYVNYTSKNVYTKTTGKGLYLTSSDPEKWPDDGYKSPYYTVKVDPR